MKKEIITWMFATVILLLGACSSSSNDEPKVNEETTTLNAELPNTNEDSSSYLIIPDGVILKLYEIYDSSDLDLGKYCFFFDYYEVPRQGGKFFISFPVSDFELKDLKVYNNILPSLRESDEWLYHRTHELKYDALTPDKTIAIDSGFLTDKSYGDLSYTISQDTSDPGGYDTADIWLTIPENTTGKPRLLLYEYDYLGYIGGLNGEPATFTAGIQMYQSAK